MVSVKKLPIHIDYDEQVLEKQSRQYAGKFITNGHGKKLIAGHFFNGFKFGFKTGYEHSLLLSDPLVEALMFYADEKTYQSLIKDKNASGILSDFGAVAREALSMIKEKFKEKE